MSHRQRIRQQLDAYRQESDLVRPEMRELAANLDGDVALRSELRRSQQFDDAVAAGLSDVPVPQGLAERILAAVGEANAGTPVPDVSPAIHPPRRRRWRTFLGSRKLLYATVAAAAVLLLAASGGYYWHRSQQIFEQEQIASALGGWQRAISSGLSERRLPSDFVLPPLPVKPQRYLPFKTAEGWSAVAVDCTTATGSPATLFIVQQPSRFHMGASPMTQVAPSGKKVATWRKGRLLYVLVEEVTKPRAGAMKLRSTAPPA